jgi:hypothetical protein
VSPLLGAAAVLLWTLMFSGVGLALCGAVLRGMLYRRHDRLLGAWFDMRSRNLELTGHPGPIDLEDFPGMRECWHDIRLFTRCWLVLMALTGASGLTLSMMLSTGLVAPT